MPIFNENRDLRHVIDNTKLTSFIACPRKFFWDHVVGLKIDAPSIHLNFGSAWHKALQHLVVHGFNRDEVSTAYKEFLGEFRKTISEEVDSSYAPKDSANAAKGLVEFLQRYGDEYGRYRVLASETAGAVPVSENFTLHFKTDAILEDDRGKWVLDFKTTSQLSNPWVQQWTLSMQMRGYLFAMSCFYPPSDIAGALIQAAVFRKMGNDHIQIPVVFREEDIEDWKNSFLYYLNSLNDEYNTLDEEMKDDHFGTIMNSFPKNPNACNQYGLCQYFDYCSSWNNPLRELSALSYIPAGYKIEHWDPRNFEKEAQFILREGKLVPVSAERKSATD